MNHFIHSISCAVVLTALTAQAAFAGDGFSNDSFPNDSAVVMNNILTRTSIRKFQQRPVEKAKVLALLKAGMAAPAARDLRPWHFVVLSDTADIHAYASTMKHHGEMIAQSPVVIYACGDTTRMMEGQARDFWVEDVSCASENILRLDKCLPRDAEGQRREQSFGAARQSRAAELHPRRLPR